MFIWIITIYVYYVALLVCQNFCYKGKISAWFMWLPDIIIIVFGILLILFIVNREKREPIAPHLT